MISYTWNKGIMPEGLSVRQVYGIAFAEDGRIFLRIDNGRYKLTGGRPEIGESFEETLRREYLEEANIELKNIRYLGYLAVETDTERFAQVRMIAQIKQIHKNHIDLDTGRMYGRELVTAGSVKDFLDYPDEAGNQMMDDAMRMAKEVFGIEGGSPSKTAGADNYACRIASLSEADDKYYLDYGGSTSFN